MSYSGSELGGAEGGEKRRRRKPREPRKPKKSRPLDAAMLRDLALSYAARFATTGAKLEGYLARKIRTRGVAEDDDGREIALDVTGLVTQMIELGYVDDEVYARGRSRDLTARGYGARRVEQALWAAGVEEDVRADNAPNEAQSRRAAVVLAQKRRFGPFGHSPDETDETDDPAIRHKAREKQVAAMLRAGHLYDHVRFILDAAASEEIEEWLLEAEDDGNF